MISLTDFLIFCARGLPDRPRQHHRDHLPHRQMDITIVNVVAIVGAVISVPSSFLSSPPLLPSSSSPQPLPTSSCHRPRPSTVIMLSSPSPTHRHHHWHRGRHHRCRYRSCRRRPHHEFCRTSCGWVGGMFARAREMTTSIPTNGFSSLKEK